MTVHDNRQETENTQIDIGRYISCYHVACRQNKELYKVYKVKNQSIFLNSFMMKNLRNLFGMNQKNMQLSKVTMNLE